MSSDIAHRASRAALAAAGTVEAAEALEALEAVEAVEATESEQQLSAGEEPEQGDDTPATMSDASLPGPQGGLSERDRRILALEGRTFRYVGAKERAIREQIGLSKVAYYVRLNALLDEPAALRAAPSVVHRLRGRRTSEDGATGAADTHRVA